MPTNTEFLDLFEQTASSIDEVCSSLDDPEWDLATDLPGWTVKDNLSHLAHYEAHALGRPAPEDIDISACEDRLENDFQRINERGVQQRRARPGREVLEEYREVTTGIIKRMRDLDDAGWESPYVIPAGEFTFASALPIRVLDFYYHEQDIRRAVDRPGHLHGAVARMVFERFHRGMGFVVGKTAEAPEGTRVRFEIGEPGRTFDIVVADGRGAPVEPDGEPDVVFSGDIETFFCVVGGRWTPQAALADDRWNAEGDDDLIERIHAGIAVVP